MKNKEEICREAEEMFWKRNGRDFEEHEITQIEKGEYIGGYLGGYTQCQNDMADKKYTLRDIEKAFLEGCASERRFSRRIDELDKYIISLNKQD